VNLIARFVLIPTAVAIPVIFPKDPATPVIFLIFSYLTFGVGIITSGRFEPVYPKPGFVIAIEVI